MNSVEMVEANCRTASEAAAGSLTPDDFATLEAVKDAIREREKVGCTGCRYCMPCPKGVDIPGIFRCYNHVYGNKKSGTVPVRSDRLILCRKIYYHHMPKAARLVLSALLSAF